jgi:hypothetical protein
MKSLAEANATLEHKASETHHLINLIKRKELSL